MLATGLSVSAQIDAHMHRWLAVLQKHFQEFFISFQAMTLNLLKSMYYSY